MSDIELITNNFFSFPLQWLLLVGLVLLAYSTDAQTRRVRVRTRPIQQQYVQDSAEVSEEDNRAQQAVQYYRAQPKQDDEQQVVLVGNDEDYNGLYSTPAPRPTARQESYRPSPGSRVQATTLAPRTKQQPESKAPPVQTIRNYNKVNDDGSFTFGYEAADGSFKEETRGTDCVVRGKYGYVDPDGNKREFTYVSGNPCDPNNPDEDEEEQSKSEESDSEENIPQNYPRRPIAQRPAPQRPIATTPRAPTTVFSNTYQLGGQDDSNEEVQIGQRRPVARPFQPAPQPQITQRPRVQIITTTPAPIQYSPTQSINITPRPAYRAPNVAPSQPPATTYRPQVYNRPAEVTTPQPFISSTKASNLFGSQQQQRQPVDFEAEFKKFQKEAIPTSSPSKSTTSSATQPKQIQAQVQSQPLYQSQLVFDPTTGHYNTQLYQQVSQDNGEFSLYNHRVPFTNKLPDPEVVSLDQLKQQSPLYRQIFDHQVQQQQHQQQHHQQQQQQQRPQVVHQYQAPQQVYQKQQNEQQFLNSQQLFAQQLELQQQQLRQDRIEAAKRVQQQQQPQVVHRFQAPQQQQSQPQRPQPFYYLQPQLNPANGQIEAFLRGQNIEY